MFKRRYKFRDLEGSASWSPGAITNGSSASTTVTVTGAELGDYAVASFSKSLLTCSLSAYVSASNTVTVVANNNSGFTRTPTAGTVYAKVTKR